MKPKRKLTNPLVEGKTWNPNWEPWLTEYEFGLETIAVQKSCEKKLQNGIGKDVDHGQL